jgi:hypothetical protein
MGFIKTCDGDIYEEYDWNEHECEQCQEILELLSTLPNTAKAEAMVKVVEAAKIVAEKSEWDGVFAVFRTSNDPMENLDNCLEALQALEQPSADGDNKPCPDPLCCDPKEGGL